MLTIDRLSFLFKRFSETECKGSSELYSNLAGHIANDEELLKLSTHTRTGQPVANMLFGAVHYLLLNGKEHPLQQYYPSLEQNVKPPNKSFPYFKDFCLLYKDEIINILQSKLVQTNEVRRCTYLYPLFSMIYEKTEKPLALIEIGTSAGIQLLCDQYAYSYRESKRIGNLDSKLTLTTECIGENILHPLITPPIIETRIGIDLHPINLTNKEERLWLKALIWPEHLERQLLLEQAANVLETIPLQLIKGDGVELLPSIIETIADTQTICIFHTHVANQMSAETKEKLLEAIETIAKDRTIFHLYNNVHDQYLHLDSFINGQAVTRIVAETEGHGKWVKWFQ